MEMSIPEKNRAFKTSVHLLELHQQEGLAGIVLGGTSAAPSPELAGRRVWDGRINGK